MGCKTYWRNKAGICIGYLALTAAIARGQPSGNAAVSAPHWKWLRVGGEIRSRVEAPTGLSFLEGNNDLYLLTRLRLNTLVTARPWLKFVGEWQDVEASGYERPIPGGMANRLDVRQAYTEIGATEGANWGLRLGRQTLKYGKGRLVSDPDWSNYGQAFDAMRFSVATRGIRLDAFAASVLVPRDRNFDRSDPSNMFYGIYGSLARWGDALHLEPYLLLKSNARVRGELGNIGALDLYTTGVRGFGVWGNAGDWEVEMAIQSGQIAGRPARGFGGVWIAGWQTGERAWQPRVSASYTYASGDANPRDGRKGTFDTLYPSVHLRNGATDRIGWANIHDVLFQADWKLPWKLKLSAGGHDFRLATLEDALYFCNGAPLVRNPRASSRHVGVELFGTADYQFSRRVSMGVGYGHLLRGAFLRESKRSSVTQPYVFLTYRF